jgi:hypothetical protein
MFVGLFEGRGMNETVRAVFGWLSEGRESTTDQNLTSGLHWASALNHSDEDGDDGQD